MSKRSNKNNTGAKALESAREIAATGAELDAMGSLSFLEESEIIQRYIPLCKSVTKQLATQFGVRPRHREDMLADAQLGLAEAWKRFTPGQGAKFSTFAYYRIKGAVIDGLRRNGVLKRRSQNRAALASAAQKLGEDRAETPKPTTQSERVQTVGEQVGALGTAWTLLRMNTAVEAEDRQSTLAHSSPDEQLIQRQLFEVLQKHIGHLEEREEHIIRSIYFQQKTLRQLSEEMGLSRPWLCRLHAKALKDLLEMIQPHIE